MRSSAIVILALMSVAPLAASDWLPQDARPTFKAGVDRVTVTAVVHKRTGEPVLGLTREDFDLVDNGSSRPILEFRSEPTPATVALLADFSGSMHDKVSVTRLVASAMTTALAPGRDRIGLFAFDTEVQQVEAFDKAPGKVLERFDVIRPFGSTSLFDAVADTGRQLAVDGSTRRAIVALTDGSDNSSRMSAAEVARAASEIDVPVYVVVVLSPVDRPNWDKDTLATTMANLINGPIGSLAQWTGGRVFLASTDADANRAAGQIVDELRHQYYIVFAPDSSRPGWHRIDVHTRQKDLIVRARSGYVAQDRPNSTR